MAENATVSFNSQNFDRTYFFLLICVCVGRLSVELMWCWLMRTCFQCEWAFVWWDNFCRYFYIHTSISTLPPPNAPLFFHSSAWNWLQMLCLSVCRVYLRHTPHYRTMAERLCFPSIVPRVGKHDTFNPTKSLLNAISLIQNGSIPLIQPSMLIHSAPQTHSNLYRPRFICLN